MGLIAHLKLIEIIKTGFDFVSERLTKEVLTKAILLLPKYLNSVGPGCKVGKMTKWIFAKKNKTQRCVFFLFMVNSCEENKKIEMWFLSGIVVRRKDIKSPKHAKIMFLGSNRVGTFF